MKTDLVPSVSVESRIKAATLIDAFVRNDITNFQLEARWPQSDDPAIEEIRHAVWTTYDDLYEHHCRSGDHELLQRCEAFLRTADPYAWPVPRTWQRLLGTVVGITTFGLVKLQLAGPSIDAPWPFAPAQMP